MHTQVCAGDSAVTLEVDGLWPHDDEPTHWIVERAAIPPGIAVDAQDLGPSELELDWQACHECDARQYEPLWVDVRADQDSSYAFRVRATRDGWLSVPSELTVVGGKRVRVRSNVRSNVRRGVRSNVPSDGRSNVRSDVRSNAVCRGSPTRRTAMTTALPTMSRRTTTKTSAAGPSTSCRFHRMFDRTLFECSIEFSAQRVIDLGESLGNAQLDALAEGETPAVPR